MADVFGDLSLFSEFDKDREAEGTFIGYDESAERSRIIFEGYESYEEESDYDDAPVEETESAEPTASAEESSKKVKVEAEETESKEQGEDLDKDDKETESEEGEEKDGKSEDKDKVTKDQINGNASDSQEAENSKDQKLSIENEKAILWLNDQLHKDAAEEAKSNVNINHIIYEKNKYRRFSRILDSTRYIPDEDSPAVQLLFSNNSFSRKYRQQIEQFIKGLLWNEYSSSSKISEAYQEVVVRPGAPSCLEINPKLTPEQRTETMRQKHTFIGSSQFHNKFQIDFLGWPFSFAEPTRCNVNWEIPHYNQIFTEVFADPTNKGKVQPAKKLKPSCWNCGEEKHSVAECRLPRNPARISASRKEYMELSSQKQQGSNKNRFTGAARYHLDPEISSKYAKYQPGQMSKSLTEALGLREDQLPQHVYNMRLFGYPPGWLEEAKPLQSNVSMFDKHGRATRITGEYLEDGELNEGGGEKEPTSDYDINKIIEYAGFTVPLPEGCVDEHETYSKPPIQEHQLKETLMKQSNEKASAKKRKREEDREEKRKAREDAKRAKLEAGEEEVEEGEAAEEEAEQSTEVEEEVVASPVLNKSSLSSCVSLSKDYGTPILVREKSDLPDASKFGVGVEEHIPFENLPNAVGTFDKMKDLIGLIRKKKIEPSL